MLRTVSVPRKLLICAVVGALIVFPMRPAKAEPFTLTFVWGSQAVAYFFGVAVGVSVTVYVMSSAFPAGNPYEGEPVRPAVSETRARLLSERLTASMGMADSSFYYLRKGLGTEFDVTGGYRLLDAELEARIKHEFEYELPTSLLRTVRLTKWDASTASNRAAIMKVLASDVVGDADTIVGGLGGYAPGRVLRALTVASRVHVAAKYAMKLSFLRDDLMANHAFESTLRLYESRGLPASLILTDKTTIMEFFEAVEKKNDFMIDVMWDQPYAD